MKTYFRHWLGVVLFIILASPQLYAQQIDYAEYFFDNDPGYGNGIALSLSISNTIDATYSISTTSLSTGLHTLYVRVRTNAGEWSLSAIRTVFITQNYSAQDKITAAEYYIDSDPGEGNGTAISITSADIQNFLSTIPTNGLSAGIHHLYIRVKDGKGSWSVPALRTFFITENHTIVQISAAEYFIDQDPGYGNGNAISITSGDLVDNDFTIPTTGLSIGLHHLYIRVKDQNSQWSTALRTMFYVTDSNKDIVAAEYFYDNDPGFGNGNSINITQGSVIDMSSVFSSNSLSQGIHHVYIRLKDENGKWSLSSLSTVYVVGGANEDAPLISGEYFFDLDPGQGSATAFTLSKGQTIDLDKVIASTNLGVGMHQFHVRLKDSLNRWSLTERSLVYVTPSEASQKVVAIEYTVDTILPMGQGTIVDIASIDSLDHTFSFVHGIVDTNYHMLYTRIKDAGGRWSLLDSLTFRLASCVIPTASFTLHDICLGDTLLLVNNSTQTDTATTYAWNIQNDTSVDYTAKDSIRHYFANPGAYDILLKVNNYVCEDTMLQTVNVHPRPVASLSSFGSTIFCPSGFTVLSTNTGIGYTYEWFRNGNLLANVNSSFYQAADTGDYRVAISNIYNCTDTSSLMSLSQYTFPDAAITAAGNTTFCKGDSVVLQANTLAGLSYEWYQNGNVISGENSNSLTVLQSGSYAVKITSLDGCSDLSSPQQIVVNANPVASLSAGGPNRVLPRIGCCNLCFKWAGICLPMV